jgi:hypothetical protein
MEDNYYRYHHHHSGLGAIILIFLGIILLLNNFGILSWESWSTIWRFWPLLLILGGLQLVMGRSRSSSIAILIVGGIFLAFIIIFAAASENPGFSSWLSNYLPWVPQVHTQPLDPYQSDNFSY